MKSVRRNVTFHVLSLFVRRLSLAVFCQTIWLFGAVSASFSPSLILHLLSNCPSLACPSLIPDVQEMYFYNNNNNNESIFLDSAC